LQCIQFYLAINPMQTHILHLQTLQRNKGIGMKSPTLKEQVKSVNYLMLIPPKVLDRFNKITKSAN
jgi:hypothetical protein